MKWMNWMENCCLQKNTMIKWDSRGWLQLQEKLDKYGGSPASVESVSIFLAKNLMVRKVNKEARRWTNSHLKLTSRASKIAIRRTATTSTRQISTIKLHSIAEIFKFLKNGLLIKPLQLFYWVLETWNQEN
jgi:hypothetical protein